MPEEQSAWIEELEDIYADGGYWEDFLPILTEVDAILFKAALDVNSSSLHDDIMKLLKRGKND